jgi:hypothetical protein
LRVQSFEFYSSVSGCELPIDSLVRGIASTLPRLHLAAKRFNIGSSLIQRAIFEKKKVNSLRGLCTSRILVSVVWASMPRNESLLSKAGDHFEVDVSKYR